MSAKKLPFKFSGKRGDWCAQCPNGEWSVIGYSKQQVLREAWHYYNAYNQSADSITAPRKGSK